MAQVLLPLSGTPEPERPLDDLVARFNGRQWASVAQKWHRSIAKRLFGAAPKAPKTGAQTSWSGAQKWRSKIAIKSQP